MCLPGNQIKQPSKGHDDKNQLSQCKELWLFWYGEKPESVKNLVSHLRSHCRLSLFALFLRSVRSSQLSQTVEAPGKEVSPMK